jgi:hypothetical protein
LRAPQVLPLSVNPPSDKVISLGHMAGPTSGRPNAATDTDMPAPPTGMLYLDTSLNKAVLFDGSSWIDPFSGSIV